MNGDLWDQERDIWGDEPLDECGLTWVSDPERDDWIFGVREEGDETTAWYSLKHLSDENDSVNVVIQFQVPTPDEGIGFCEIVEGLYQTYLTERANNV